MQVSVGLQNSKECSMLNTSMLYIQSKMYKLTTITSKLTTSLFHPKGIFRIYTIY